MTVTKVIEYLQQHWQGPVLKVVVENRPYQLGQGETQATVIFHNPKLLPKLLRSPSLVFGEAYMSGEIELEGSLSAFLEGYYRTAEAIQKLAPGRWLKGLRRPRTRTDARQAVQNAQHHYDIGNDFYKLWLDSSLTYSCAYFLRENDSLAQAQEQKRELLCRKMRLQAGQSVLDIGCGWGALLFHMAKKYNAQATGITPANEQADFIEAEAARRGLQDKVKVIRGDWRELQGSYDRIVSVGMFEHVGQAQYREFFQLWSKLLAPGGISLLHTIGRMATEGTDPWIDKYIFPGGWLPALDELTGEAAEARLIVTDVENLWQHYTKTLAHWSANFLAKRAEVVTMFDERFARMWWLYLQGAESWFRLGSMQLWQVVMIKDKTAPWPLNREVYGSSQLMVVPRSSERG